MQKIKELWASFAEKHPKLSVWVREGGLFIIVSNVITILKTICLMFLPHAFAFLGSQEFGFPGVTLELFGYEFKWYIIGANESQGGLKYFVAYMVSMFVFEAINFFIQRKWVFRSNGNIAYQGMWYFLAFCVVTCIVGSIDSIWKGVIVNFIPSELASIATVLINGGVSMVIFFIVNKIVFNDARYEKKTEEQS